MEEGLEVYECVNCLRPAFTGYCKKAGAGEFAAKEEFLVFAACFRLVLSPKCSWFNGHTLCLLSCRCEEELGYFLPHLGARGRCWNFIARVGSVKARDDPELASLLKYVKNEGRNARSLMRLTTDDLSVALDATSRVEAYVCAEPRKRRKRDRDGDGCQGLVGDLVFGEILPRLPIESLRRCKEVCKGWRHGITTDSHFISNHLHRCSESTRMSILLGTYNPRHRMLFVDHGRDNKIEIVDVSDLVRKFVGSLFNQCHVVGSCDGLVCLRLHIQKGIPTPIELFRGDEEVVVLWNPETGQLRDTRAPPTFCPFNPVKNKPVYGFGFGFDKSRNDYKVVKVWNTPSGLKFDVFSRNTGRWVGLEGVVSGCEINWHSKHCVLVQTRLHWLLHLTSVPSRLCVLWFDLSNDEFGTMDILDYVTPKHIGPPYAPYSLINWKDCLAFIASSGAHPRKELRFQLVPHHPISLPHKIPWKLCGVLWDRFFVEDEENNVVMYDFETGVARPQKLYTSAFFGDVGKAHEYVPSFVSVYPDLTTMSRDTTNGKARFWVGILWTIMGLIYSYNARLFVGPLFYGRRRE